MKKLWTFFILVVLLFSYGNKVNAQYCTTGLYTTGCTDSDDINDFSFGTIVQTATGCTDVTVNAFADYTALSTTVTPGVTYPMTFTNTYGSAYVKVWVDFNNDFTFDAATEELASSNTGATSAATLFTTNLTIPLTAAAGSHRMRVRLVWGSSGLTQTPCGVYGYGEIHDYTINVASSGAILPPTAFTATPFSISQINLSWTQNASLNNVIVLRNTTNTFTVPVDGTVYTVGSLLGTATVIYNGAGTSFSDGSLSAQTTYYYKAYSVTGSNAYSVGPASASATTPCSTTPLPWNEGFEGLATVGANILPNCWSYTNITSTNYSCNATCNSNTAHTGTNFIGGSWSFDVWNYTPGFQLTAGTSYDFSYWFKCTDNTIGYDVSLFYGNAQNVSSMTNSINAETGLNINTWTQRVFSFTPATTGVFYFGIHTSAPVAPNGIGFDDFQLIPTPACPAPTALTATGITSTSANLVWTSTAATFDVEFGTYGFVATGTPTNPGVTNGFTKSGLSGYTRYSYYVRSICAGGALSPWSGPYSFYTLCAPVTTFPFTENFVGALIPPNACWNKYGGLLANPSVLSAAGTGSWLIDDYLNVTSPVNKTAKINIYGTANGWLVTPQFDLGGGATTYALKFNLGLTVWNGTGAAGTTGTDDKFAVVISTDGGTTWSSANVLRMWDNAGSSYIYNNIPLTGQSVEISLAGYTGLVKIAFYGESTLSNADNDLFVDDVVVYQPANMSYVSSTATQPSTAPVVVDTKNNVVLGTQIVTTGSMLPLSASTFVFNTTGTTNAADISKAKLWSSGTNSSAATAVAIDSVTSPSGSFTFTPIAPSILAEGTNYFWLTYDISPTATNLNIVDAEFTSVTVGGTSQTPTVTAPAGSRTIKTALNGIYTIDNTLPTAGVNFANFTDVANDLNTLGISGPVTFNVTAGQTFPMTVGATPYNYAFAIATTGTPTMPIVFQRFGSGANPVIAVTGSAATNDIAVFNYGADYITFDGIDVTNAGTSTTNYVDYGYYYQGTATNGCNYNTLKNSTVTLSNLNTSANGVFINSQATAIGGKNNYNKFYNNTIKQACYGYKFVGKSGYYDIKNEIGTEAGGSSVIRNLGNPTSITVQGVALSYQDSTQIFNTLIDTLYSITPTAGSLCGIQVVAAISNFNIYNNTIRKIVGYETYGINFTGAAAGVNYFHHNTFTDISSSVSGNLNVFRDETSVLGTCHIYNNQIYNIYSTFGTIEGFYLNSASIFNIYNNKIYNLSTTAAAKQVEAIAIMNAANNSTIYNNEIYDLKAAASSTIPSTVGIRLAATTTAKLYNNTVYLDYVSTNATNTSACVYAVATPTSLDMRNNIFINKTNVTSFGTRAVAFWWASTTYTNINAATNNNLYYAGVPSFKNLIFYNGVNNDSTLKLYKTRLATKDQASKTEDVPFLGKVYPYNLNIQTTVETQAESGGVVIPTFTADILGTPRYPNAGYPDNVTKPATAPDLGAYEFAGITKDLTPPSISYTDLLITSNLVSRTLTATITDQSSVNVTTYKPRVYYKKTTALNTFNDNTNATQGWKYVETTSTTSPFSFDLDYSKLYTAPVVGDTLQYFVVAQDNEIIPNFGAYVATFTVEPTNVDLTAANFPVTGSIKQFKFVASINGTILVGQGNPFNCLTCAGDTSVFKYINNNVLTGNLELVITSNLSETGVTALNQIVEEGSGSYTVTIRPQADVPDTIKGSYAGALIRLNGADRVIFDGRFAGEGHYLTFANTATSGSVFSLISLGAGLGATNNTIRNCNMYMGGNALGTYGISVGGTSTGTAGSNNHNNSILYNNISKVYVGIYAQGNVVPGLMDNLNVTGNILGHDSTSMYLGHDGIIVAYTMGTTIAENKIFNIVNTNNTSKGISLLTETKNTNVSKNYIDNLKYTGTVGYGSYGLYISTGNASSNLNITNNIVSRISGDGYSSFGGSSPVGIYVDGVTGGLNFYYNTVNMSGNLIYNIATLSTAMLLNTATITNVNMKNNIFVNTMRNTTNLTSKNYAIYSSSPATAFTSINNNLYYVTDTSLQSKIGFLVGDKPLFTDWQSVTLQDANSVSGNPQFTSDLDLTPLMTSPALTAGTPIAGVTSDITGKVRALFTPTIGAYEVAALKALNLTLFLQGLYNGTGMVEAQDGYNGPKWGTGIADHIDVELRNGTTYTLEQAFTNQELNTDGTCTVTIPASMGDSYFIVIKHRNSIQTWSSLPISFGGTAINYDFTTDASFAYGNNMKQVAPGVYAIYIGDVNQDDVVDITDLGDMDADLTSGTVTYIIYDLDGNGSVDISDIVTIDENLTNGVGSEYPIY